MCSDALPFTSTPHDFALYAQKLLNISQAAGAVQASVRLLCAGRTVQPRWEPFNSSLLFKDVQTAHPVLFVSNEFDNVTPLISARKNAKGFKGARVVVQRGSWGHTSLAAPSVCMAKVVRRYFVSGEMPGEDNDGVECWGDVVPFGEVYEDVEGQRSDEDGDEDEELRGALWRLSMRRRRRGFGGL